MEEEEKELDSSTSSFDAPRWSSLLERDAFAVDGVSPSERVSVPVLAADFSRDRAAEKEEEGKRRRFSSDSDLCFETTPY